MPKLESLHPEGRDANSRAVTVTAPAAHVQSLFLRRRTALKVVGTGLLPALAPGWAAANRFPDRPLTLVVPFAPGGIADLTARAVAEQMARTLGQAVVVDNKPSAGSIVASQAVVSARPDGHTLLLMSNGHAVSVSLFRKLPYDPEKDFTPISLLGSFDLGLFVPANSRFNSLAELISYSKVHPGKLNIGTIAVGSTQHLAAKLFETLAGIDAVVVPYRGSPAVLTALRAGELDLAFEITGPMMAHLTAGAVRALAVSSDRRNPALPEVPTVQQAGLAGYNVASWNALAAPAGTPPEVVAVLQRSVREALSTAAVQDKLGRIGMRLNASTSAELQMLLASEIRRWGEVIRKAKIEPE